MIEEGGHAVEDHKKKLVNEYKQRTLVGGTYKITNTMTEMYLLGHAADIKAMQNRFVFSVLTSSCIHPKLRKDWDESKGSVFAFEILDTIKMKEGQSQSEFIDELKALEDICRENLDASLEY